MIKAILELADLRKGDILYDLGSGDGRILIEVAKKGIKAVGVEENKFLNWFAKRRIKRAKVKNVRIIEGDIFEQDISKANVIIAYLSRSVTLRLQKKIEKEAKKGTRIIIVDHYFKKWKPLKVKMVGITPIRLYVK